MAPIDAEEEERKGEEGPEDPPIVKALKEVDDKYLELEREYEKEVNELMKKYTAMQKPFLDERRKLLTTVEGDGEKVGTPALKGFWLKAMQHCDAFEDLIQKWDEPVLEYLVDIEKSNLEDDPSKGFKLLFTFSENPYFTNTELWKIHYTEETNPYNGDITTKKIEVNEIEWKAGKNVTVEKVQKKVKGGGAKKQKQKGKEKEEPRPSFFRNFHRGLEPGMKITEDLAEEARHMYADDEDDEDDEGDDDEVIEALMDNDTQIGATLRDCIVPFAVRWYTGEAAPDEGGDDEDEEEEEEDDEDEDESEDEPAPKAKAKAKAAGKKKGSTPKTSPSMKPAGEPKQEECKQQ